MSIHDPNHVRSASLLKSPSPTRKSNRRRLVGTLTAAVALGLLGALATGGAAQAATTKTVIWRVTSPAGFADRFATPQVLASDTSMCGNYQIDVYRYASPRDIAFVDAFLAKGVLTSAADDGFAFVSNTDVAVTTNCTPAAPPAPTLTPKVTPTLPGTQCVEAGAPRTRTASFLLDNTTSTGAVTFTAGGVDYPVAAGATLTTPALDVPEAGTTFTITAAGQTFSYPVASIRTCAAPTTTPVSPPRTVSRTPAGGAGAAAPRTATTGAVTPAATAAAPVAVPVAPAAVTAGPAGTADAAADSAPTLAYTGTAETVAKLGWAVGITASGIGMVLWSRKRRREEEQRQRAVDLA